MSILFSTYPRSACKAPEVKVEEVASLELFERHVLGIGYARKEKDGPAVSAPCADSAGAVVVGRGNADARPWRVLMVDVDESTPAQYEAAKALTNEYRGFIYSSYSHMKEKPNKGACPRFRMVFELSRPATAAERWCLTLLLCGLLKLMPDESTKNAARLFYTARAGAEVFPENRKPSDAPMLDVDATLLFCPEADKTRSSPSPRCATTADPAEEEGDVLPPHAAPMDHMLKRLYDEGAVDHWDKEREGAVLKACPFEAEHSTEGGARATMFIPWFTQKRTDSNGRPYRTGRFRCMHDSCRANHPDGAEWYRHYGMSYEAYVRACPRLDESGERVEDSAQTPERFDGSLGYFTTTEKGSVTLHKAVRGGEIQRPVVSGLHVIGRTSSDQGSDYGLILSWRDDMGRMHRERVKRADLLAEKKQTLASRLAGAGLRFQSSADLLDYLRNFPDGLLYPYTTRGRIGWFTPKESAPVFVLPSETLGDPTGRIMFAGTKADAAKVEQRGSANEWRQACSKWAECSSRIALALCASFAAPCLELVGVEGGGFNIVGPSSKGKSLALYLAASVYGRSGAQDGNTARYQMGWDMSATAFELRMAGHNSLPAILDEAGTADVKQLGRMVYMITNGVGRERGAVDGDEIITRERKQWRTLTLSASEKTARELLESAGRGIPAGMEVRLADINACPSASALGVFESLPEGCEDARAAADAIERAVGSTYGAVGLEWLRLLVDHHAEASKELKALYESYSTELFSRHRGTQAGRLVKRLALCAAVGEYATAKGFTGWPSGLAWTQIQRCAVDILGAFKVDRERLDAVRHLLHSIQSDPECFKRKGVPYTHNRKQRGLRWYCAPDGTVLPKQQDDEILSAPETESPLPDETGASEAEEDTREQAFFFFDEDFKRDVGAGHACDISEWLRAEGALAVIGGRAGRKGAQSRLGARYGAPSKDTAGYIVLANGLTALSNRIA